MIEMGLHDAGCVVARIIGTVLRSTHVLQCYNIHGKIVNETFILCLVVP